MSAASSERLPDPGSQGSRIRNGQHAWLKAVFESEFVRRNLQRAAVAAEVGPYKPCGCTIKERVEALLLVSNSQLSNLYYLDKEGAFRRGDPRGIAFATARLAAGAQAVRDMIVQAWEESAETPVGYPMVNVKDIESGKVRATRAMFDAD